MIKQAPKFAVVLSGCGVYDGSEIHEATCALLAIDENGGAYQCFAPSTWQARTMDHYTGESTAIAGDADNRNVLAESARIARGNIKDLTQFNAGDFDAIVFPGGLGAAMNWSDFAAKGPNCAVNQDVENAINESFAKGLVIGAICIAPTVIAKVLGEKHHVKVTVGLDKDVATGIAKMGAVHENCKVEDACVDAKNKIVTTPAYMLAKSIKEVHAGVDKMIKEMLKLM